MSTVQRRRSGETWDNHGTGRQIGTGTFRCDLSTTDGPGNGNAPRPGGMSAGIAYRLRPVPSLRRSVQADVVVEPAGGQRLLGRALVVGGRHERAASVTSTTTIERTRSRGVVSPASPKRARALDRTARRWCDGCRSLEAISPAHDGVDDVDLDVRVRRDVVDGSRVKRCRRTSDDGRPTPSSFPWVTGSAGRRG